MTAAKGLGRSSGGGQPPTVAALALGLVQGGIGPAVPGRPAARINAHRAANADADPVLMQAGQAQRTNRGDQG